MSQTNNDNIKRPKLQGTLLGILKTYAFCQKLQRRASGSGESTAGVTWYDFKNTPTTWWFKEGHSWSIAVTQLSSVLRLHGNTSDLMLLKATTEPAGPFGTMPYEP